jgi:signal transduction histidine kinase
MPKGSPSERTEPRFAVRPLWFIVGLCGVGGLVALDQVPLLQHLFALPFLASLLGFALCFVFSAGAAFAECKGTLSLRATQALTLLAATARQTYVAFLVAWAAEPGASVFAGCFVFVASFQAFDLRVSLKNPIGLAPTLIAAMVGWAVSPGPEHGVLFFVVGPVSLLASVVVGTATRMTSERAAESERLRAALHAQILEAQSARLDELTQAIVDLLGYHHDVNGPLMAAQIQAEAMLDMLRRNDLNRDEMTSIATDLARALGRIPKLLSEARNRGQGRIAAAVEHVPVASTIAASVEATRKRFAAVDFRVRCSDSDLVRIVGGPIALQRIVDNLLVNACEGDGRRGARTVQIDVAPSEDRESMVLVVVDDGPGFSADHLAQPVQGFATTKRTGTGLGLYTVERLARASGGSLERARGGGGGARLTVRLPAGFATPEPSAPNR